MNATKRPQTIQIFLPTGDPNAIRQAEITTRSVRVFDVSRSPLKLFAGTPDLMQPGDTRNSHRSCKPTIAMTRSVSL